MGDGRVLEVWSFGAMRVVEFHRLAFGARATVTMSGRRHQHVVTMLVHAGKSRYELTGSGSSVDSAVDSALEQLARVQRDAGTAALA